MLFTDNRGGRDFAKDPAVVFSNGKYFMYYSTLPDENIGANLIIGIAVSQDGENREVSGSLPMTQEFEKKE